MRFILAMVVAFVLSFSVTAAEKQSDDLMVSMKKSPSELVRYLFEKVGPHYFDRWDLEFPDSERAAQEVLSLPVYPEMTEAMRAEVAGAILGFFGKK